MNDAKLIAADAALIAQLGGPAKLAESLGYKSAGGVQRVHNWVTRGIPSKVKVERPDLFLRALPAAPPDTAPARALADHPSALDAETEALALERLDPRTVRSRSLAKKLSARPEFSAGRDRKPE